MLNSGLFVLLGLLLLPQVYAFGAGSMFITIFLWSRLRLTTRYRFDFRGRGQELAPWRY